ncbi:aminotransferase class IV [Streptomyces sp. NPDC052077]|uniref:aminotransferase class IV n=1 Tax=Streptomyces sp. NPDC052077 TaxID=3154757 RepID=UPI003443AF29
MPPGPLGPTAPLAPAALPELLAADSWLVADGAIRALDRHQQRFAASCAAFAGLPAPLLGAFWAAMTELLPRGPGTWFPRVELERAAGDAHPDTVHPGGVRLLYRQRPAPPLRETTRVWGTTVPDPRRTPRHKGPDLGILAAVRGRAAAAGADEALLVSADGVVHEAVNSSLLWWEGDVLCHPAAELPTLPGVTARLLTEEARRRGVEVAPRRCRLPALAGREVWVTNALHGLTPVTAWTESTLGTGAPARAAGWRAWLEALRTPLP